MGAAVFFFDCDNERVKELVLLCVEAGLKVEVRLINELEMPAECHVVSVPGAAQDSPCQQ